LKYFLVYLEISGFLFIITLHFFLKEALLCELFFYIEYKKRGDFRIYIYQGKDSHSLPSDSWGGKIHPTARKHGGKQVDLLSMPRREKV
jgi:hypothetical protein